ncbi:MAG TPA: amidohydrolase family protein [Gaiellaceae bacterium]
MAAAAPPTVDFHQHLWPPHLVEALRKRAAPPRIRGDLLQLPSGEWPAEVAAHDLETRVRTLDDDGIDLAVISCPPTLELDEELTEAYHDGILETVASADGRLVALASGSVRDGFVGTCVPASALSDLDTLSPVLDALQERGQPLFVHPGAHPVPDGCPPWWPSVVSYTSQMQAAYATWLVHGAAAWPRLRVVFAMLAGGAPIQIERLASRGVSTRTILHESIYLETSSYASRALDLAFATYGVGQIVYGSDRPVVDSSATLRSVREFGQALSDAVCRDNPARILT